jgi:hypothetical protein
MCHQWDYHHFFGAAKGKIDIIFLMKFTARCNWKCYISGWVILQWPAADFGLMRISYGKV